MSNGDRKNADSTTELVERAPSTIEMGHAAPPKTQLGIIDGVSTIVGLMVGSGIFTSAQAIHEAFKSSVLVILVWLVSGLLSLTGALCYAELGTLIPGSGGEAQYLQKAFGGWATFVFNFSSIIILKPASTAVMVTAMSEYTIMLALKIINSKLTLNDFPYTSKVIAIGGIMAVTMSSCISTKASFKIQEVLTYGKLLALGFVIFSSIFNTIFVDNDNFKDNILDPFANVNTDYRGYAVALTNGLFGFDGWNNLNMIAGDVANPGRTLPLSIWISMVSVIVLYSFTIFGYYSVLSAETIASSSTIGVDFGAQIMGRFGSILMAFFIVCSTFGSALSGMVTSSEIVILAADNGHIPKLFGRISKSMGTAQNAYIMQAVLAVLYVCFFPLMQLVNVYTIPTWIFYGACVVVLLILRFRMPKAHRPYRVWWTTPFIFLVACILLIGTTFADPKERFSVSASIGLVLVGIPIYFLFVRS